MLSDATSGTDVVLANTRMAAVVIGERFDCSVPFIQKHFVQGIVLGATKE